ncbi:MAG: C45 family autoproteolytic acyltransferase/hydrolase [Verrucomicrobiae bacterium]|nr:C45 family autoproteolytic acyltransferase/hydrolase [Verrucomicrobiae bacterium]
MTTSATFRPPFLQKGKPFFSTRMAHVCLHLLRDNLPQSAPDFPALLDHLRYLADLGYNSICLEAEAMLPYSSAPELATRLTWTPEQTSRFAGLADQLGLEIVPLLQCLGHNYFILEHPAYAHLRESPGCFQQYCPTNPAARKQFLAMAGDIQRLFPNIRRFHVGGDECRMLGVCPRCKKFLVEHGVSELYLQHVAPLCNALLKRGLTPLLWSDMFEHHPEALDQLPHKTQIVYWNYQPATWPRPLAIGLFQKKKFPIIGASGILYGGSVSDLVAPYQECLRGIADLTRILKREKVKQHLVTNWTKGTSWELADWGWFFGAAKSHAPDLPEAAIARQYAEYRFGLRDKRITEVHRLLAVPLPFAETVQLTWWDHLNRFDHTGAPYPERREKLLSAENRAKALEQIEEARKRARAALAILWREKPRIKRGWRQWELLENAARETLTRAEAASMAMVDMEKLPAGPEALGLAGRLETVRWSLRARRQQTRDVYARGTPAESVSVLCRIRYSQREEQHLEKLEEKLTGQSLVRGISPVVIPVLDNPGPPYERGLEHGRVFAEWIWDEIELWRKQKNNPAVLAARDRMEAYLLKHFPWLIEEMRGIASGAGLSLETILWLNVFNAMTGTDKLTECSTALYRHGKTCGLMKTSDIDASQRKRMLVQIIEQNGMRIANCGWVGTVWTEFGMNSAGLAVGCDSAPAPAAQPGRGLPQHLGCYPLLASCRTTSEAVEFMKKHPFAGKGLNIGALDARGSGVIFERAAHRLAIRPMKGNFIAATNHYVTGELAPLNASRVPEAQAESTARLKRITEFLGASRNPAVKTLQDCAAIDKGEGRVCKRTKLYPTAGLTLAAAVCDCSNRKLYVTGLPPADRQWAAIELSPAPAVTHTRQPKASGQTD